MVAVAAIAAALVLGFTDAQMSPGMCNRPPTKFSVLLINCARTDVNSSSDCVKGGYSSARLVFPDKTGGRPPSLSCPTRERVDRMLTWYMVHHPRLANVVSS